MSRIGFFVPSDNSRSGINKVVENLVKALTEEGKYERIDLVYIVSHKKGTEDTGFVDVPASKTKSFRVFLGCEKSRKCYYQAVKAIRNVVKQNNYDTVVCSGMEWSLSFYFALKNSDVHMLAWEHLNFGAGPKFRLEWIGKRLAVRKFDGILCITKKDQEQYLNYTQHLKHHAEIYQIYNLTAFSESSAKYNAGSKKIISCGYLAPIKGYDLLVHAAAAVLKRHSDWTWDIFGEGGEQENIETEIQKHGLKGRLNLKGYNPNVNALYKEYGLFVLTSRAEGMGMVLIEAQLSHLPAVSFDIPCGPSDVIVDEVNGALIRPFDTDEMGRKICELIENTELRVRYSENAMIRLNEFNKQLILKKWKQILK